jgi:hypothetical protein
MSRLGRFAGNRGGDALTNDQAPWKPCGQPAAHSSGCSRAVDAAASFFQTQAKGRGVALRARSTNAYKSHARFPDGDNMIDKSRRASFKYRRIWWMAVTRRAR